MHAEFSRGHKASPCLSCKLITSGKNYRNSSLQGHINSNANPKLKNNPKTNANPGLQKRGLCVELANLSKLSMYQITCISGHNFTLLPYSSLKLTCNRLWSRGYMLERHCMQFTQRLVHTKSWQTWWSNHSPAPAGTCHADKVASGIP